MTQTNIFGKARQTLARPLFCDIIGVMYRFQQTREAVRYSLRYISGKTLDLGAGSAKYREIIKARANPYITFDMFPGEHVDVVGDALNLPFDENSFDTIISTQVLEHVEKPWIMIKEIGRTLKPGGLCVLTTPFMIPYHPDPRDYFRYTTQGIRSLFENEGFETVECGGYGRTYTVLSEFFRFSWFDPYKKPIRGSVKISRAAAKLARFLDKFNRKDIIYSNVFIVARKKA